MHAYKESARGRSLHFSPIDGIRYARLTCSACEFTGKVKIKSLMPPEQLDNKFQRTGWELDPHICPTCISKRRFERQMKSFAVVPEGVSPLPGIADSSCSNLALAAPMAQEVEVEPEPVAKRAPPEKKPKLKLAPKYEKMAEFAKTAAQALAEMPVAPPPAPPRNVPVPAPVTTPSKQEVPAAMSSPLADNDVLRAVSAETHKAAATMHKLLAEHFDGEEGRYAMGWSDERIANDTGLSVTHVSDVRDIAYGALKTPDAIAEAKADIKALSDLFVEMMAAADKRHDEEMDRIEADIKKEVAAIQQRLADAAKALGFKF